MIELVRRWLQRFRHQPDAEPPAPLPVDLEASLTQYQTVTEHISKLERLRVELGQLIIEAHSLLPAIRASAVHARYEEGVAVPKPTRMDPHPLWPLPLRDLLERGWNFDTQDVLQHELKRRKVPDDVVRQLIQFE